MIGQCLVNGFNRKDHNTLDNSDIPMTFGVIFMFLDLNYGAVFDQRVLKNNSLDGFMTLPLTNENNQATDDFKDILLNCIYQIPKKGFMPKNTPELIDMINWIETESGCLKTHVQPKELTTRIQYEFSSILNS